jgi:hypothetical protein
MSGLYTLCHCIALVCTLALVSNAQAGSPTGTPERQASRCSHPVPVEGHFDAQAPNLTVQVETGVDPYATARKLAHKYHFNLLAVFSHAVRAFVIKDIDPAIIPMLQCEHGIKLLSFAVSTSIA